MKKILALVAMALVLAGCNDTKTVTEYVGEPEVVEYNIEMVCDVPLMVDAQLLDDNITVQLGEDNETHANEFGVDFALIANYACPEPEETEREPVDGVCDEGWEFANDCATVCTPIVEVCLTESLCGEGTFLDENNTCQIDNSPEIGICGEGTELVDGNCTVIQDA